MCNNTSNSSKVKKIVSRAIDGPYQIIWLFTYYLTWRIPALISFLILFMTRGFFICFWAAFGFSWKSASTCSWTQQHSDHKRKYNRYYKGKGSNIPLYRTWYLYCTSCYTLGIAFEESLEWTRRSPRVKNTSRERSKFTPLLLTLV